MPPEKYFSLVHEEIRHRSPAILRKPQRQILNTVYFGGGTPSLVSASHIVAVLQALTRAGFQLDPNVEITLEINPATVDTTKMEIYQSAGINRFSVGAQTFDDALLRSVRREHNSQQTRETLALLQNRQVNYSFDLLFALPGQTLEILRQDLAEVERLRPPHISPYCLTVPEGHVLSAHRPPEGIQIEMFELLHQRLTAAGYQRYEISNYALPGFESRHNSLYWEDQEYWGIGLSAHSYLHEGPFGERFWNASAIGAYEAQIQKLGESVAKQVLDGLPDSQFEQLHKHQALTDFCHTSLRLQSGLKQSGFVAKFGVALWNRISPIITQQVEQGLLRSVGSSNDLAYSLTDQGLLVSNQVFGAFTFLANEIEGF